MLNTQNLVSFLGLHWDPSTHLLRSKLWYGKVSPSLTGPKACLQFQLLVLPSKNTMLSAQFSNVP